MSNVNALIQEKRSYLALSKSQLPLVGILLFFITLWFTPPPEGLTLQSWHLFAVFLTTILSVIAKILPMGALCVVAIAVCTTTKTLTLHQALHSFSSHIVWLTFLAFLLARGFIKTGLGGRIAYYFVLWMGKSTLGLAYGLVCTDFFLAPFVPSNTARGAGIVFPIVSALTQEYGSSPNDNTQDKIGSFLMKLCYQTNIITSAMFLTAMAGNPLIASLGSKLGVEMSWSSWCLASIVPGLLNLALLPWILYLIYPPIIKHTPEAPQFAHKKLQEMGKLKKEEWIMLGTFGLLLVLWIFGKNLGIDATSAAFIGLAILLSTNVLSWDDILKEHNAWHTFMWLATFLMMSHYLTEFGLINWFSQHVQTAVAPFHWITALGLICLVYFYSHYMFASIAAHIGSMFAAFGAVAITAGAPPFVAIMLLTVLSSLCAGITHYGTGTGPVYFGANFITVRDWWRIGFILSIINLLIWGTVGPLWWKIVGFW